MVVVVVMLYMKFGNGEEFIFGWIMFCIFQLKFRPYVKIFLDDLRQRNVVGEPKQQRAKFLC
jgi:hypothetical protein